MNVLLILLKAQKTEQKLINRGAIEKFKTKDISN